MSSVVKSVFGGSDKQPDNPPPAAVPEAAAPATVAATELAGPQNKDIEARASEFATRGQVVGQRASAAGATRSDNEADLLGYVAPKRKTAARTLLG